MGKPLTHYLSVPLGALFILGPAFLNNYPFLYSDTCIYVDGGFLHTVNGMRPITYGLFLRNISLMESFWLVVLAQALIVSWLIHLFFVTFSQKTPGVAPLATIVALSLGTNIGISVGMLMPDFFTPAALLAAAVLFFGRDVPKWSLVLCGTVFWFGIASHHSNLFIFIIVVGAVAASWLWAWYKKRAERPQRLLFMMGLLALSWLTIPTLHYIYGGTFERERASHVFMVSRFAQMGLLRPFLEEKCASGTEYNLCAYKDKIPDSFLWSPESPVYLTGGWEANRVEYKRLIGDFLTTPKYLREFCIKTAETVVQQFFCYEGQIVFREKEGGAPVDAINRVWPQQLPAIRASLQYRDAWEHKPTDRIQHFVVTGAFLFCIWWLLYAGRDTSVQRRLAGFLLIGLAANALICGGVSMIDPRFQSRVIWLVPMFALWLLHESPLLRRNPH